MTELFFEGHKNGVEGGKNLANILYIFNKRLLPQDCKNTGLYCKGTMCQMLYYSIFSNFINELLCELM